MGLYRPPRFNFQGENVMTSLQKKGLLIGSGLSAFLCVWFYPEALALTTASPSPLPSPLPSISPILGSVVQSIENPVSGTTQAGMADFLGQVWAYISSFGGLSFVLKMSGLVAIIIASVKVSLLRPLWDRLGNFKALVGPVLSLFVGVVSSLKGDHGFSLSIICAYLFSGSGAVIIHEILDILKAIPGISPTYLKMIELANRMLAGPNPLPADAKIPAYMGTPAVPSAGDTLTSQQIAAGLKLQSTATTTVNAQGTGASQTTAPTPSPTVTSPAGTTNGSGGQTPGA